MVTDNTNQTDETTAFLRTARSGNLEKVIEYLDTDLDINTANSNGLNALHLASKDGHVEIVTELLKRGAKVDAATKKGNTALHIASLAGQSEIVNILIQYGAAVNIQSQNGFTPLYMAAQENHDQVVKLLLANGANQSLSTEDGFTPLAVAMQQGHDKVVTVLLENDSKGKVRLPALHIAAKKDDCKAADLLLQNDHKPDITSKSGFTPLHIAAHYGNEEVARLLIKRGADVNYLAKHNISPMHVAAKWGKNNIVKILVESSAQIDAKTRDGLTPLHCAARSGHEKVVSTLLENSAPISARTKNGLAPLHMASQGDHVDAARVLLYHRAPVDEVTIDYLTALHVAAHCGHVRVAKLLLDRKADPNARALNGFTPLHIACKKNRIKVVELLLKHGASIESTTESGLTPLHVASFMGCMNIVIFLLQHEAHPDVPTVRGETPLHLAARANQTDIIRILLRNGAKVDARAREEQTPLHIASRLGNIDIVMLLLQHGAAVDTTTKDMYTALHIAAKEGQEEVAAFLVENNASVKAATKNGYTPLHIAAKYGNMNVANILLQKDSKLDAQGKNDITPLHLACHYDHPNVANLLLEKGASPHLASQNGHTPLHIAARKNQMDIASTLLETGANANAESKAGFTPLHLSAQKGHYDMTNLLIEHGADPNHKAKNGLTALHLCAQEDFIRVASILVKNGANVESQTETGYRPIHVAAHFGNLSMIRFLSKHNAEIDVRTGQNYTPLHQAAQQGHAHIVSALLEGNASHKARTNDGLTALNIAQKLGYISVMEVLKGLPYDSLTPDNKNWEEKYRVIAPESLQETSFMSDSDDEGASDALISEQPYRYLTADLMKSLRDDSLPIDVTRDDPVHRPVTREEKQEFVQSNNYCLAENFDSNDTLNLGRLHFRSFLVSFLVDARGGAMKGCRHSGVRIIVPPRRATMPIRVTCRLIKPNKVANPPPLMEGEALATRIIEMGPVGVTFLGPVLIDIPHFASIRGKEREIIILRSENGETWKEHDNAADNDDTLLNTPYDSQMSATHSGRITRIITTDFPQYFAIVTRIKQEVHVIGAEGGILISSVASHVQAVFPPGALTKKIKVGLQAHVIPAELTAKLLGNCVAVSPVITIEPRRRKFHKPITLTVPVPQAANKGMINQYGGETPTLRLLCSIAGGTSEAQWEDVTGSTPLTFMNDRVSFTTTVSARFWLMDCRNTSEVPKMATDLYKESLFVPYITNFIIYSKRIDVLETTLRILCMTDGKEGMHTLEKQEEFLEIVKSRDVEALDGKDLYIEFSGNLVPVTKSGVQLKFTFKAFRQNRLSFHVKVKDPLLDPVARMLFMREPKVAKDAATIHESFAQKAACPLESVDASYPNKISGQQQQQDQDHDTSPTVEKQTYSEKRKFWEDISKKRESYQRSESEISRTSQLTINESDSEYVQSAVVSEGEEGEDATEITSVRSETMDDANVPDISECSVAEKAHYFEEQIQKEMAKAPQKLQQQDSVKSDKDRPVRIGKSIDDQLVFEKDIGDFDTEGVEVEEKYVTESRQVEKSTKTTEKKAEYQGKEPKSSTEEDKASRPVKIGKSIDDWPIFEKAVRDFGTEGVEVEEKYVTESRQVEKSTTVAKAIEKKPEYRSKEPKSNVEEDRDKVSQKLRQLDSVKSDKDRPEKAIGDFGTEGVEVEEKYVTESRQVEKSTKSTDDATTVTKIMEKKPEYRSKELKLSTEEDKDRDESGKEARRAEEDVEKRSVEPVMEICKELLNRERELALADERKRSKIDWRREEAIETREIVSVEKEDRPEKATKIIETVETKMKDEPEISERTIAEPEKLPESKESVKKEEMPEIKKKIEEADKKMRTRKVTEVVETIKTEMEKEEIVDTVKKKKKKKEKVSEETVEATETIERKAREISEKEELPAKITKSVEIITTEERKLPEERKMTDEVTKESSVEDAAKEIIKVIEETAKMSPRLRKKAVADSEAKEEKIDVEDEERDEKERELEKTGGRIEYERQGPEESKERMEDIISEDYKKEIFEQIKDSVEGIKLEHEKEAPMHERSLAKEAASSGRRVIKEETTIIWKVREDGTLVQERVTKTVQIEGEEEVPVTTTELTEAPEARLDRFYPERSVMELEKREEVAKMPPESSSEEPRDKTIEAFEKRSAMAREEASELLERLEEDRDEESALTRVASEGEAKLAKKESRIPVSTAKTEKERTQKETKEKIVPESRVSPEKGSVSQEKGDASPTDKKKEFESRIPKRIVDAVAASKLPEKEARKDFQVKTETETRTVTEKSSQEVTSKSERQTFSKTFVDPRDAFKEFEDTGSAKGKDYTTVTSKIDRKASSKVEKKEVTSSKVSVGSEKFVVHEEKERVERKRSSDSRITKETPVETTEEKKSKSEESDKTAVQKTSMNWKDGKEVIDASASESRAEAKKERVSKTIDDEKGTLTRDTGSSKVRESDVAVAVRIHRDEEDSIKDEATPKATAEELEDLGKVETIVQGETRKEVMDSFDVKKFEPSEKYGEKVTSPTKEEEEEEEEEEKEEEPKGKVESLEERQEEVARRMKARNVAETLIQSIESEIVRRSSSVGDSSKAEPLSREYLGRIVAEGIETDHEKLADHLTRKFETMLKKSVDDRETILEGTKEAFERSSKGDSTSTTEDSTKDEDSSLRDKEESYPPSSSHARLPDRDVTISPSSISDRIELEETLDVDTNEFEDVTKPTSSLRSEKLRSDRSSAQAESLQRESYEPRYDVSFQKDKIVSEISGARVLEILEPGVESQSRQDSVDVPSLEMDENKFSEDTGKNVSSLHESAAVDSLDKIDQGERDVTVSPGTVSEDDYSLIHEQTVPVVATEKYEVGAIKRADSFEIESPPLISPRSKVQELEIKPVDWMIGDEKIEISETLQPSEVFNRELEEYETSIKERKRSSSYEESESLQAPGQKEEKRDASTDLEQESIAKSSEDVEATKSTGIPLKDEDLESELIENKLDISCQELVDMLQRQHDARTPIKDYPAGASQVASTEEIESKEVVEETRGVETYDDRAEEGGIGEEAPPDVESRVEEVPSKDDSTTTTTTTTRKETESKAIAVESMASKGADKTRATVELKLEKLTDLPKEERKSAVEGRGVAKEIGSSKEATERDTHKTVRVDDALKEWTEAYLTKGGKPSGEAYKRHAEKSFEKHEKPVSRPTAASSETCAFKIKKDDLPTVDLSARYAITVLDQVVKKEIAEVKESLEAAKQDLIEELSENSDTVIQIKDSPSEFQFKIQPESILNDLPFLYRPPSLERIAVVDTEVARTAESTFADGTATSEKKQEEEDSTPRRSFEIKERDSVVVEETLPDDKTEEQIEKSDEETLIAVHEEKDDDDDEGDPSPVPASRSCSDVETKDESSSLLLPQPVVPRRRHKPAGGRSSRKVASESEADIGSSSGESSNYQSCDYDIGSGSRPSSSDVEALQSATMPSGTTSEYETAMMSVEHSTSSRPTSQEYVTAVTTMSSRESMKSLTSLSSGHLGSIDSTSELSETLVPSESDVDKEENLDERIESALDEEEGRIERSDSSGSDIPIDEAMDKIDSNVPCRMKRSSEMIFQQIVEDNAALDTDQDESMTEQQEAKGGEPKESQDSGTSAFAVTSGTVRSVDIMTSRVTEDGVQSVCTQVISTQVTSTAAVRTPMASSDESDDKESRKSTTEEILTVEPDFLEAARSDVATDDGQDTNGQDTMGTSVFSLMQQASMSTSSTSGVSIDTVVERDRSDRHSPDSDSFELVSKPDIMDDFIVIEEVGREAEEFDTEGKSIRISTMPQVASKRYDRDLENLMTESSKEESRVSTSQTSRNNELFEFESEESPPQASNDDQYSHQSYSDEDEGGKKWIEMQFQAEARVYDIEYDRGPLEDIKEEEITDFEAGSSRFGSLGSQKESIGSVGSMRGSYGSTPDYDVLAGKKYFAKPSDHDNVSLSSLQEFEHLESTVAAENSKRHQCGSQDSINNGGSLPRRYVTGRSAHGDDVSLSSLKDFEGLEKACREAHLIELRAREEEDLLEHESPENRYKLESALRKSETSAPGSVNPSTSGSDDYEKRIKEIDEIIRIAQSNVERLDRQDDTTEDISQIEITDAEKVVVVVPQTSATIPETDDFQDVKEGNVMETSTDSLELEDNADKKHHPLCRSSDSLEMKTTLDFPSLSSDSLNNVRDAKDPQLDTAEQFNNGRRISSDSLDVPLVGQADSEAQQDREESEENGSTRSERATIDDSLGGRTVSTETNVEENGKAKSSPSSGI